MNDLEELPLAVPIKVSAPPFEGDGTWIWIDNTNDTDEYNIEKTNIEFSNESWLKTKINTLTPVYSKKLIKF